MLVQLVHKIRKHKTFRKKETDRERYLQRKKETQKKEGGGERRLRIRQSVKCADTVSATEKKSQDIEEEING